MFKKRSKDMMDQENPVENQEAETAAEEVVVEENTTATEENGFEVIEKLQAENAELKDRLMRALAEIENIRRRTDKEKTDMAKYAVSPLAKELMPVADNLQRAMESLSDEAKESADEQIKTFITGVEMTEKMLQDAFGKNKIEYINPEGEKFDYKLHQAMTEVENSGQPAGTVVHVMQPGYVLNERLLRPAMVAVAKGTPEEKPDNVESVDT
ncbi:nucleotide exchange factor GrpE, partial [Curvivirga aplysinae]|uniref:nucleotide exchange factor GrpE n=1 Tax=Curvivirga aplysinae TaxID=2529852 RepID=UPI0012BBB812